MAPNKNSIQINLNDLDDIINEVLDLNFKPYLSKNERLQLVFLNGLELDSIDFEEEEVTYTTGSLFDRFFGNYKETEEDGVLYYGKATFISKLELVTNSRIVPVKLKVIVNYDINDNDGFETEDELEKYFNEILNSANDSLDIGEVISLKTFEDASIYDNKILLTGHDIDEVLKLRYN